MQAPCWAGVSRWAGGSDPKRQPVRDFGETPRLGGASKGQGLVCQTPLGWEVSCA